ncbi:unnamed protein product [Ostreobium quekettii]|uniref:Uncharacterized protein n=1 Tax=Ostreobium quekettii TaxID=121088 RepID=A0A8S1IMV3_9CHLO|nr:unnamed protein product [Ostreobium quekettii]
MDSFLLVEESDSEWQINGPAKRCRRGAHKHVLSVCASEHDMASLTFCGCASMPPMTCNSLHGVGDDPIRTYLVKRSGQRQGHALMFRGNTCQNECALRRTHEKKARTYVHGQT